MPDILQYQPAVAVVLNRLFRLLTRSLPMYLEDAKPWSGGEATQAREALARLVADQRMLARRLADAIVERGAQPEPGAFPMEFATLNDVAFDYLLCRIIERLQREIEEIETCLAELSGDPRAHELVEEVLGNAQGHLDVLKPLAGEK
jgi:hypothetical protein